ncbi:MAG TPA: 50S ribosomal protein L18 [Candidatus Paceibacterota bacterium]|jgi:large subunit ribosomal protein L18|nr:50S ribosomal protein L18 [Parcubacteria group bacterium]MDP6119417.1 50S ribosomal protein L18 [Candidatus Paceibacterota bacterium]HJN63060.1 50S ribosomal protein L18 [Candidatus Paceibacterota bacterium]|tara:strand:- start:1746 stop:2096 length:351 start_codon:yes stop_codon:yes gene_type:complete
MEKTKIKTLGRVKRRGRIRSKVFGTSLKPRLSIFKSNKNISAQLIDDSKSTTLASSTSAKVSGKTFNEKSKNVGLDIAKKAKDKKIKKIVFDRGGYIYTGNVESLAEGAREGGLIF